MNHAVKLAVPTGHLDLVYEQYSGGIYLADYQDARALMATGYSGKGTARNCPDREAEKGVGPIPRGMWRLSPPIHHPKLGPCAIRLSPIGHAAHGRSGFFIHGDSADGDASSGCIIAPRGVRQAIVSLGCATLLVV